MRQPAIARAKIERLDRTAPEGGQRVALKVDIALPPDAPLAGVRVIAGAASVAIAIGADAGIGVSIGLSIALNDVGGETLAYVAGADNGSSGQGWRG